MERRRVTQIVRSPGGTAKHVTNLNEVEVPDCWHIAQHLAKEGNERASEVVLETWHLCHDLVRHLRKLAKRADASE